MPVKIHKPVEFFVEYPSDSRQGFTRHPKARRGKQKIDTRELQICSAESLNLVGKSVEEIDDFLTKSGAYEPADGTMFTLSREKAGFPKPVMDGRIVIPRSLWLPKKGPVLYDVWNSYGQGWTKEVLPKGYVLTPKDSVFVLVRAATAKTSSQKSGIKGALLRLKDAVTLPDGSVPVDAATA